MVISAKMEWLTKHLPSVIFDEMRFLPYEGVKNQVNNGDDILFDDEQRHHDAWTGESYFPDQLLEVLRGLL
jgi:5'(3')-deoxyribonucleotidase